MDPLAEDFVGFSPYNYTLNNPVLFIDPDGRSPLTIFKDKNGNVLHETQDGLSATVVVSDDKVNAFNEAIANLDDQGIFVNQRDEEQKTVSLFENFASDGQTITTVKRADGSQKIVSIGDAPLIIAHQIGVTGTVASGLGATVGFGVAWDSKGNVGLYGMFGGAHGGDMTLGIEYTQSVSSKTDFSIKKLSGVGVMKNGGIGFIDFALGGNANTNGNYGDVIGTQYISVAAGVSAGIPLGGTRTAEETGVFVIKKK